MADKITYYKFVELGMLTIPPICLVQQFSNIWRIEKYVRSDALSDALSKRCQWQVREIMFLFSQQSDLI